MDSEYGVTPKLSHHARQRCAEMGVRSKDVKRIVSAPHLTRPTRDAKGTAVIAVRDDFPEHAVVFLPDGAETAAGEPCPLILTVVFRTTEDYDRQGATFTAKASCTTEDTITAKAS